MKNKGFISTILIIVMLVSAPFTFNIIVKLKSAYKIYTTIEQVPKKEFALVLGAAAYGNILSDILKDRVDTAIELFKNEKVSMLLMSGSENETNAMKNYAINKGIPAFLIIKDYKGLNTLASIKNASALNKSMIIVSQKYHLPRALFIADSFKINAIGITADKHNYLKINQFKRREFLAISKAILDLLSLSYQSYTNN